ncbi:MAG: hypothetical protein DRJ52_03405, partial [Thermoprotei archaeon]
AGSQIDTPWTGIEFEVAAHMISEGMVEEAFKILKAIHERYARYGEYWNHIECGGHYYRPMDSWLVLMALEGLLYNGFEKRLRLMPKVNEKSFKGLLTVTGSWGLIEHVVEDNVQKVSIKLDRGSLKLKMFELKRFSDVEKVEVFVEGKAVEARFVEKESRVVVELSREIDAAKTIEVRIYYR